MHNCFPLFCVLLAASGCSQSLEDPGKSNTSMPAVTAAPYTQVGPVEDTSYAGIRRVSIRITIPNGHTRAEVTEALKEASEQLAQREGAKATMVFAYRPGDRAQGFYTLGRATCAPNGKWEDAGKSGPLQVVVDLNTEDKELGIAATPEVTPKLSATKVRCNKFRIDAQEVGHMVKVSLDTDLPGDTELMVEVGRDYRAVVDGKADTYTEDYLEEKSTVAEWRREHNIDVSDSIFRQKLRSTEDRLTAAGIRNKRRDVSSQIAVRFTVPINQANQEFGKGNANLQGPASIVTRRGSWNIIQREKTLRVPLKSK